MARNTKAHELEAITPQEAVEWYLQEKRQNCSENTVKAHGYRLSHFTRWCKINDINNLNTMSGRLLQRYRTWRRDDGNLNNVTLHTQMTTLRVFIRWCEKIDAVSQNLGEKVDVPSLNKNEDQRDKKIEPEEAFDILDHLRKFEYATKEHIVFELMWHTAARVGEIRALDLDDYYPQNAYLQLEHRPEGGTPLKNRESSERLVGLSDEICGLLDDYIKRTRIDVTDDHKRQPLVTTENGRPCKGTLRWWIYRVTQPCFYKNKCPKDRQPERCEATGYDAFSKCPVNYNPHAIRRGSLTYHLLRDWSKEDVEERANVSPDILEKHYDRRTDKEKLDQRRNNVENL